jgi:drug/metabolite transporter (DMT)-like permease
VVFVYGKILTGGIIMFRTHIGEFSALLTAMFWTVSALSFESAGKKVGSLSVNFIRLIIGFALISIYTLITRGMLLPLDASGSTWIWLILSGLIGFVIGDLFLFQAYIEIGSRISMLVMSFVPPITALISFIVFEEKLTRTNLIGMGITILGIAIVVLKKKEGEGKVQFSHPVKGLIFAFMGALGQAFGTILSKLGMKDYNPFAATQIRIIAGIFGFAILLLVMKKYSNLLIAVKNTSALKRISLGALFGPFLGVSFSLLAIQHTTAGVAATITAIVPVLIIPPAIILLKEKITAKEMLGSIITIIGVGVLFL